MDSDVRQGLDILPLKWKRITSLRKDNLRDSAGVRGAKRAKMKSEYIPNWDQTSSSIFMMMNPNSMSSFDDYFFGEWLFYGTVGAASQPASQTGRQAAKHCNWQLKGIDLLSGWLIRHMDYSASATYWLR